MIEWSGDTRGNGEVDGWELLHVLIVRGCTGMVQIATLHLAPTSSSEVSPHSTKV